MRAAVPLLVAAVVAAAAGWPIPSTGPTVPDPPSTPDRRAVHGDWLQADLADVTAAPAPSPLEPPTPDRTVAPPPAPAQPAPSGPCATADDYPACRGRAALPAVVTHLLPAGWTIVFLPGRDGMLGLARPSLDRIEIYVRHGEPDALLISTIAHEVGHAVDFDLLTDAERDRYRQARGLDRSLSWYGCSGCTDFATPAGDFAEVFNICLTGVGPFRSELAGRPTAQQCATLADVQHRR